MFDNTMYTIFQFLTLLLLPIVTPYLPLALSYAILFVVLASSFAKRLTSSTEWPMPSLHESFDADEDGRSDMDVQEGIQNDWWDAGITLSDNAFAKVQDENPEVNDPQYWGYPKTEYCPTGISLGPKYANMSEYDCNMLEDNDSRLDVPIDWDEEDDNSIFKAQAPDVDERITSLCASNTPLPDHIFDKPGDLLDELPSEGLPDTLSWFCYIIHDMSRSVTASPSGTRILDHLIRSFKAEKRHAPLHQLLKDKVDKALTRKMRWEEYPFFEMDKRVFDKFGKELKMQEISRRLKIDELVADLERARDRSLHEKEFQAQGTPAARDSLG